MTIVLPTKPKPTSAGWGWQHNQGVHWIGASSLAEAGHLLRFSATSSTLTGERWSRRRITCLGPLQAGQVVAGLDDGTLVSVDPTTLRAEKVGAVPGVPVWIGARPAGGLVVAYGQVSERSDGQLDGWVQRLRVRDLVSGRTFKPAEEPTTFLLDSKDRLWLGRDNGEWGGGLSVLDLTTGSQSEVERPNGWEGVFGITELSSGQVWAYGGTAHLGSMGTFVVRVDGRKPVTLFQVEFAA